MAVTAAQHYSFLIASYDHLTLGSSHYFSFPVLTAKTKRASRLTVGPSGTLHARAAISVDVDMHQFNEAKTGGNWVS
ncbi:MAG: hypothetical protein HGA21_11350 [Burkholderiaceae bacterium]|jgi:hypothetical protein|nr:hypothetical protein [Burkholderiaceae bacterium]